MPWTCPVLTQAEYQNKTLLYFNRNIEGCSDRDPDLSQVLKKMLGSQSLKTVLRWVLDLFLSENFRPFLLLLSSSFCLYVLCFHGIISDIAMTPFSDSYFDWQNTVKGGGVKVVTIGTK